MVRLCRSSFESMPSRNPDSLLVCRKHMLETLAGGIPDERWDEYEQNGWLKVSLNLTRRELKLLHLSHRLALCELGVTPTEPHTWENAKFHVSINGS